MLGIWYLFSRVDLFSISESNANLTVLSLFTVITIGDMKIVSE